MDTFLCARPHRAIVAGLAALVVAGPSLGQVKISEIRINQPGSDLDEFFELKGSPGTSLDNLWYITIGSTNNGDNSGILEHWTNLTGFSIAADGHFLAVESDTFSLPVDAVELPLAGGNPIDFQNTYNVTHLLVLGFDDSTPDNTDLDTDDDGTLDLTPWTAIVDSVAVIEDLTPGPGNPRVYSTNIVGPDGIFLPGGVYLCETAEVWQISRFGIGEEGETPGAMNVPCQFPPANCGAALTGDCFTPHPSAGCDETVCCSIVCANDPFCCEQVWDSLCVEEANFSCTGGNPCGDPTAGSCNDPNTGSPGCVDADCCNAVCLIDVTCCDTDWDQACVDIAATECVESGPWIINEINADPSTELIGDANGDGESNFSDDEFVEIYNNTGGDFDISGWQFSDAVAVRHVFPDGTVVPADCSIVVFGGGSPTIGRFGSSLVQTASSGAVSLNNSGETVTLADSGGTPIAVVTYTGIAIDQSLTRDPDITGPLAIHSEAVGSAGALFSPGTKLNGTAFSGCADADGDGQPDITDNCVNDYNPEQRDCDDDGVGDVCDPDSLPDNNGNNQPDNCDVDPTATGIVINEIRINHPGIDTEEFVELRGPPGASLNGLFYVVLGDDDDGSGAVEEVVDLSGNVIQADGLFLIAEDTFTLVNFFDVDLFLVGGDPGELNLENSDTTTHMLVANFSRGEGDNIDLDNDGTLDDTFWTDVLDAVSLLDESVQEFSEFPYAVQLGGVNVQPEVLDGGFEVSAGHVFRCDPTLEWAIGQFELDLDKNGTNDSDDTPDAHPNAECPPDPCVGDIDMSGFVDTVDFLNLLGSWGPCPAPCPPSCAADFNGDCVVDTIDFLDLLGNWGPCP